MKKNQEPSHHLCKRLGSYAVLVLTEPEEEYTTGELIRKGFKKKFTKSVSSLFVVRQRAYTARKITYSDDWKRINIPDYKRSKPKEQIVWSMHIPCRLY